MHKRAAAPQTTHLQCAEALEHVPLPAGGGCAGEQVDGNAGRGRGLQAGLVSACARDIQELWMSAGTQLSASETTSRLLARGTCSTVSEMGSCVRGLEYLRHVDEATGRRTTPFRVVPVTAAELACVRAGHAVRADIDPVCRRLILDGHELPGDGPTDPALVIVCQENYERRCKILCGTTGVKHWWDIKALMHSTALRDMRGWEKCMGDMHCLWHATPAGLSHHERCMIFYRAIAKQCPGARTFSSTTFVVGGRGGRLHWSTRDREGRGGSRAVVRSDEETECCAALHAMLSRVKCQAELERMIDIVWNRWFVYACYHVLQETLSEVHKPVAPPAASLTWPAGPPAKPLEEGNRMDAWVSRAITDHAGTVQVACTTVLDSAGFVANRHVRLCPAEMEAMVLHAMVDGSGPVLIASCEVFSVAPRLGVLS